MNRRGSSAHTSSKGDRHGGRFEIEVANGQADAVDGDADAKTASSWMTISAAFQAAGQQILEEPDPDMVGDGSPGSAEHREPAIRNREFHRSRSRDRRARVTTPSVTHSSSAIRMTQASASMARSRASKARRIMTMLFSLALGASSHRGDAVPETFAPFRFKLGRNARQHRSAEAFQIGVDHDHAALLERIGEF